MITICNGPLTGRGEVPLVINTVDGDSKGMNVAGILETACYYRANMDAQADTADLATMRKLNKILDAVEKPDCCVVIEDDQYEMIRPTIDEIVTRSWTIHAPSVIDQLEKYEDGCADNCDSCDSGD